MSRVAIIGTSGRGEDGSRMTNKLFDLMIDCSISLIKAHCHGDIHLISGGAAGADHVAVRLFLDSLGDAPPLFVSSLKLFLPCEWVNDSKNPHNIDTNERKNPGRTANKLHYAFSQRTKLDSLKDIFCALSLGAEIDTTNFGFHARNKKVAENADMLIAFTFGSRLDQPKDGGTMDTWNKCKHGLKIHVPLGQLENGTYCLPKNDSQSLSTMMASSSLFTREISPKRRK